MFKEIKEIRKCLLNRNIQRNYVVRKQFNCNINVKVNCICISIISERVVSENELTTKVKLLSLPKKLQIAISEAMD